MCLNSSYSVVCAKIISAIDSLLERRCAETACRMDCGGFSAFFFVDEGCLGVLQLEDGRQFGGISFGFKTSVAGEVVFNTGKQQCCNDVLNL